MDGGFSGEQCSTARYDPSFRFSISEPSVAVITPGIIWECKCPLRGIQAHALEYRGARSPRRTIENWPQETGGQHCVGLRELIAFAQAGNVSLSFHKVFGCARSTNRETGSRLNFGRCTRDTVANGTGWIDTTSTQPNRCRLVVALRCWRVLRANVAAAEHGSSKFVCVGDFNSPV